MTASSVRQRAAARERYLWMRERRETSGTSAELLSREWGELRGEEPSSVVAEERGSEKVLAVVVEKGEEEASTSVVEEDSEAMESSPSVEVCERARGNREPANQPSEIATRANGSEPTASKPSKRRTEIDGLSKDRVRI